MSTPSPVAEMTDWLKATVPTLDLTTPERIAIELAIHFRIWHRDQDQDSSPVMIPEVARAVHTTNIDLTPEQAAERLCSMFVFTRPGHEGGATTPGTSDSRADAQAGERIL